MASTINAQTSPFAAIVQTADNTGNLAFQTANVTALTIDTSQNVGIGTASPTQKLDIAGSGATRLVVRDTASTGIARMVASGADVYFGNASATGTLNFQTNSSNIATFDVSGNLGLGVTPSAWNIYTALQLPAGALSSFGGSQRIELLQNAYYNSGFYYTATAAASMYRQTGGQHQWSYAASGTVGTAITFTQAMTLDASGNLGIGTTSPSNTLVVSGSNPQIQVTGSGTTSDFRINAAYGSAAVAALGTVGAHPMFFFTSNTERMRIDSSGNVGIGANITASAAGGGLSFTVGSGTGNPAMTLYSATTGASQISFADATSGTGAYDGYVLYNQASQYMAFGTAATERMRIDSSGNVGIGTNSPSSAGNVNNRGITLNGAGTAGFVELQSSGTAYGLLYGNSSEVQLRTVTAIPLLFGTNTTERMRISSAGGLSVGTTADPGAGAIYATGNITAYYSDDRLKTKLGGIENALDKVKSLSGFYYEANQTAQDLGYQPVREVGVSAQQVQAVLPEVVKPAPIDQQYLTVDYERLVPLLIEAIKELEEKVAKLEGK